MLQHLSNEVRLTIVGVIKDLHTLGYQATAIILLSCGKIGV